MMKRIHTLLALATLVFGLSSTVFAQNERNQSLVQSEKNGWEYEVRAGVNIGGASPMPLPKEIRKINSYSMEIIDGGQRVAGNWTGKVNTVYKSSFVTLPVLGAYRINDRWKLRVGPYVSYRMDGEFSGFVSDGYLRSGSPIGEKVNFTDDKTAVYDFNSNLRRWLWGFQAGGSWRAFKHFTVNADLTYGINNIFSSDFHTVTFTMYPIYMNIGFGYVF